MHLAPVSEAGDRGQTGPFCHTDASQEEAVIRSGLPPHSSLPSCSIPASQPLFHTQASLLLDLLRKAPADASGDGDNSPAALQGRSQRGHVTLRRELRRMLAALSHASKSL